MAYDALRTIMPIAGWPEERAREVEITVGADQVLPTRFRIGAAGAAPRGPSDSRAGQHTHGTHPPPFQIEEFGRPNSPTIGRDPRWAPAD
jgi:hypothetical protein